MEGGVGQDCLPACCQQRFCPPLGGLCRTQEEPRSRPRYVNLECSRAMALCCLLHCNPRCTELACGCSIRSSQSFMPLLLPSSLSSFACRPLLCFSFSFSLSSACPPLP